MNNAVNQNGNNRLLLISINNLWRYSNIGIDQIAGYLRKKNFRTVDVFYHHKRINVDEIINNLDLNYDFFGFSVNATNVDCCVTVANFIKLKRPKAVIVFGGGYPTRYYRELIKDNACIDYIILGDGEIPLENLLNQLNTENCVKSSPNVASLFDQDKKLPYCNGKVDYHPAFDYFINDTNYRNRRKEYCLQTKNNICTGKCAFCTERKGPIIYKEISHIIEEIAIVANQFGIKKFFFTDDNLLDPNNMAAKKRIYELCAAINEMHLNLVFKCYIKATSLSDTEDDHNLLQLMSDTGFKTIFVGLESGNQNDLKLYNKLTTVDDNYNLVKMIRKYEMALQVGFINFNPYSTLETIKENYYFLTNIEMDNLFMYICSYLRVYKYTDIYEQMKKDNLLLPEYDYLDDKSLYKFMNKDVEEIFNFIQVNMISRVRNLDFEFDWFYSFFLECKKINPKAKVYENLFTELKFDQLEKIKAFFYILFVENDLLKAEICVNDFLSFFENLQPRLLDLHSDLVTLYIE